MNSKLDILTELIINLKPNLVLTGRTISITPISFNKILLQSTQKVYQELILMIQNINKVQVYFRLPIRLLKYNRLY